MIDGIKIYDLKTDPDQLLQNPYLAEHWTTTVNNADGVIKYGLAEYFGLKFQLKHGKVRLQGSVHKYHNAGRHNYNDFRAVDVAEVVKELSERFEIDTAQTELNNVEFGVNVVLPFGVGLVLDNLIVYKGEPFQKVVEEGMSYYQCKRTKFIIKIYDKGKQYKLPENILRFEIKVIVTEYLKTKGVPIRYLSDLLDMDIYEPLGNILTEVFEGILFGDDTLNENDLNSKERELYLRGSNPKAWQPQKGETERKRLQRLVNSFKGLLERHRKGIDFRRVVSELIRTKSLELSRISQSASREFSVLELGNIHFISNTKKEENTLIVPNGDIYYTLLLGHTPKTSATPERMKIKLCSGCGCRIDQEKKYHSLDCKFRRDERNGKSNPQHNFRTKYRKSVNVENTLFDISGTLILNEQQNEWINRKLKKNYSNKKS